MGLADEFERRIEKVVEGAFTKVFKSNVQPAEIGRRLLREMEGGKSVSVGAVYVPNAYTILLGPAEHERFAGMIANLQREFIALLKANAKERRWIPSGPVTVGFRLADEIPDGRFDIEASHVPADEGAVDDVAVEPCAELVMTAQGSKHTYELDDGEISIGRASSNEIVLNDTNASREHARLVKRDADWWIVDMGSTNGTLVNESLIKERRLTSGDRVKIGSTEFEFRDGEGD